MSNPNRYFLAVVLSRPMISVYLLSAGLVLAEEPLVFDKELGHYRDLSIEALSDKGLSWQERVKLFGGETTDFPELTVQERIAKEAELTELLRRIGIADRMIHPNLNDAQRVESALRKWLDAQTKNIPAKYTQEDAQKLRHAALGFFRAYEILEDPNYLKAGLSCADRILEAQLSRGHWSYGAQGDGMMRIQDGFVTRPFWIMLYAHKLSGDKKYFESARRAADVLLTAQSEGGGWPDQWIFPGGSTPSSGVRNGAISFNDSATNATFRIMVMMYHLTNDRKYIAKLGNLGPWLAKANLGKGEVAGWSQQYHGDGRPARRCGCGRGRSPPAGRHDASARAACHRNRRPWPGCRWTPEGWRR